MAVHNWVRCHWRNGRHDLHDLPNDWRERVEAHFARSRSRASELGVLQIASIGALEVAWVECEVPLGSGECPLTYRRARAVHALIRPSAQGGAWKPSAAEALLSQRYGEPAREGLAAQHRALAHWTYPDDAARALGLFVGRAEPLPSDVPSDVAQQTPRPATGQEHRDGQQHRGREPSRPEPAAATRCEAPPADGEARSGPTSGAWAASRGALPSLDRWIRGFRLISPDATREPAVAAEETIARTEEPPSAVRLPVVVHAEVDVRDGLAAAPAPTLACERAAERSATPATVAPRATADGLGEDREDREEEAPETTARDLDANGGLFDLSTPRPPRSAPPSSLSGLLGPTQTTPIATP